MKVLRYKKFRKILAFYGLHHAIKAPYRILIDAEFIQAARDGRIMIREQLPKLFDCEATPFLTSCTFNHIKSKGEAMGAAAFIARTIGVHPCNHPAPGSLPELDCIKSLLCHGNPEKFIAGLQSRPGREFARTQAGLPLIFIRGAVPVFEKPNFMNREVSKRRDDKRMSAMGDDEKAAVAQVKKEEAIKQAMAANLGPQKQRHKKKVVKGPNPLSVKKGSKKGDNDGKKGAAQAGKAKQGNNKGNEKDKNKESKPQGQEQKSEASKAASDSSSTPVPASSSVSDGGAGEAAAAAEKKKRQRHRNRKRKHGDSEVAGEKSANAVEQSKPAATPAAPVAAAASAPSSSSAAGVDEPKKKKKRANAQED